MLLFLNRFARPLKLCTMPKRRSFIHAAIGLTAAGFASPMSLNTVFANTSQQNSTTRVLPKRLKKGDTIGLIAPGYALAPEVLEEAKASLGSMGFKPVHTQRILGNHGYFSDTDEGRAADLNEMFADPNVSGILCARGGYGCTRILHRIDYDTIRANPKVLIGFSDVTALLQAINVETGLVCFHGPVGSTLNDSYSMNRLRQVVMEPRGTLKIKNKKNLGPKNLNDAVYERYIITEGTASGKLIGGSLTLINALIGTPHEMDFTDTIVCIEDVEEAPYRIDRMLTQLIHGKTFTKAAGIVFGVCAGCDEPENSESFTLKEVIMDRIAPLGIPAVYGMSFGHVENNFTFPIGIKAEFNAKDMTLTLQEKAVL